MTPDVRPWVGNFTAVVMVGVGTVTELTALMNFIAHPSWDDVRWFAVGFAVIHAAIETGRTACKGR